MASGRHSRKQTANLTLAYSSFGHSWGKDMLITQVGQYYEERHRARLIYLKDHMWRRLKYETTRLTNCYPCYFWGLMKQMWWILMLKWQSNMFNAKAPPPKRNQKCILEKFHKTFLEKEKQHIIEIEGFNMVKLIFQPPPGSMGLGLNEMASLRDWHAVDCSLFTAFC